MRLLIGSGRAIDTRAPLTTKQRRIDQGEQQAERKTTFTANVSKWHQSRAHTFNQRTPCSSWFLPPSHFLHLFDCVNVAVSFTNKKSQEGVSILLWLFHSFRRWIQDFVIYIFDSIYIYYIYYWFLKRLKYTRPPPATEMASHRATAKINFFKNRFKKNGWSKNFLKNCKW